MYDQPSTGHRVGPALIALLAVLAAAGGSAGYFGTKAIFTSSGTPQGGATTNRTTGPAGQTHTTTPGNSPQTSGGGQTGPTTTQPQVPPGDPNTCPAATVSAVSAAGIDSRLTVKLYIRVHRDREYDSEVWICQNAGGLLVYQGHVMRAALTTATSDSSLLIAEGIKGTVVATTDGYTATNPTSSGKSTEYRVSRTVLTTVDEPGDRNMQDYPVIVASP